MNGFKLFDLILITGFVLMIAFVCFQAITTPQPEQNGNDFILIKENSVKELSNGYTDEHIVITKSNSLKGLIYG